MASKVGSTFKSVLGANLISSALTSGIGSITSGIGSMVGELNGAQKAWKTFEGNLQAFGRSAETIAQAKKEMQDFATKTIYSASDMASTYSQLDAVGTKNVGSLVKAFGGLAASAENPAQAMKSLSTQATQMASKPKVAWMDFKIMMEQAPAGMAAVAKEMGMSTAELVSAVQDGKIKTEDFFEALNKAGNSDAFQKMATEFKTVDQAIDGMKESLSNKLMPAFEQLNKFGIKAGEVIVKVNDENVSDWDVDKVVSKIRGEVGTSVKLTLLNNGQTREVSVVRQNITSPAVEAKIDGEIGILKVSRFGDDTVSLSRKYASEFVEKGVKKVVLDLRNNPGGTVSAAQGLLGLWLDKQVAMTERRGSEIVKTINTTGSPILGNVKTVVLINGGSASASEIVAGALRDYDKAKLVGQKSYGKGSVQIVIGLPGGSQMKVTEARWYTPKGSNIDKTGIEPDVKVDLSADDINNNRDPQMDKAKSL